MRVPPSALAGVVVPALLAAMLSGCAPAGPRDTCLEQGYLPGGAAFDACDDANGAPIATGPGSPYAGDSRSNE